MHTPTHVHTNKHTHKYKCTHTHSGIHYTHSKHILHSYPAYGNDLQLHHGPHGVDAVGGPDDAVERQKRQGAEPI